MTLSQTAKIISALLLILALAAVVLASIAVGALGWLIIGVIGLGVSVVALLRASAKPISIIADSRLEIQKEHNRHVEKSMERGFAPPGYEPYRKQYEELPAPKPEPKIDERHDLLVSLCLLTIRSKSYGPASNKLMSANDAQADQSGLFADRTKTWEAASKYGQDIGYLYTQVGGKPEEQGLKVHGTSENGERISNVSDLLVALHDPGLARKAAIAALPGGTR